MQARIVMRGVLYQVLFTEAAEPQQVAGRSCCKFPAGGVTGTPRFPPSRTRTTCTQHVGVFYAYLLLHWRPRRYFVLDLHFAAYRGYRIGDTARRVR
jgi:hypothetical protein